MLNAKRKTLNEGRLLQIDYLFVCFRKGNRAVKVKIKIQL